MGSRIGYPLALTVCVAAGVAALAAAFWTAPDRTGLTTAELLRIEELDPPTDPLTDQVAWTFEVIGGEREVIEADVDSRFGDTFGEGFTFELLRDQMAAFLDEFGPTTFVRPLSEAERILIAVAAAESGDPLKVSIELDETGDFMLWLIEDFETGPRFPGWAMAITAFGGWAAIAASVALRRWDAERLAWGLLAGSLAAFSSFLVLWDDALLYTLGRTVPTVTLPIATWLLVEPLTRGRPRLALGLAAAGSVVAGLAVLTRDPRAIGHPDLGVLLADDETVLRVTLASAGLLAAATMATVVWVHVDRARSGGRWRRPPHVAAAAVASAWSLAAALAVLDVATGGGRVATGAMRGVTMAMAATVPLVVLFRQVSSRWDRPELAGLVIDIGASGTDLGHAVRRALDDDSARVLASSDGVDLTDRRGVVVDPKHVGVGRGLVLVRSDDELVGAIEHDAALPIAAERVGAIAAAVGLALRVDRLNAQVKEQLVEVEASRARIIEASDDARRRVERDLHDGAQQRLVGLGMQLQRGRRLAETGRTDEVIALLEEATAEARAAIDDLRAVSRGAPPALLADRGLRAAVEALAERSPVPVAIAATGDALPDHVELTAYYVIAEAMTNSAKHARAHSIDVSIQRSNGVAVVRVADDGVGGATPSHHSGLEGLQDRVAAAGGTIAIDSDDGGTTIEAELPCG